MPCISDLLSQSSSKLGQQISMLASRGFCVQMQLRDLAGEQRMLLRVKGRDIALSMLNLPRDALQLRSRTFACDRRVDLGELLVRDCNRAYRDHRALFERDCEGSGFQWIEVDDRLQSVFAWLRAGWHVALAYVIGFAVMLVVHPWAPDTAHKVSPVPVASMVRAT